LRTLFQKKKEKSFCWQYLYFNWSDTLPSAVTLVASNVERRSNVTLIAEEISEEFYEPAH